jgi:hypothetical protein
VSIKLIKRLHEVITERNLWKQYQLLKKVFNLEVN